AGIADELLGDDLVERKRVSERTRTGIWHASHLQHGRNVRIAALTLNPVCHVEDHAGRPALRIRRHEPLEAGEPSFVRLAQHVFMAAVPQRRQYVLYGLSPVSFRTGLAQTVDHSRTIVIPNDSCAHQKLQCDALHSCGPADRPGSSLRRALQPWRRMRRADWLLRTGGNPDTC